MAEVIVIDSSSDDGDAPPPAWRPLAAPGAYADAVRDALAMVAALETAAGPPRAAAKKAAPRKKPAPAKRPRSASERETATATDSAASALTSPAASPQPPPQPRAYVKRASRKSEIIGRGGNQPVKRSVEPTRSRMRLEPRPLPPNAVVVTLSSSDAKSSGESMSEDSDDGVRPSQPKTVLKVQLKTSVLSSPGSPKRKRAKRPMEHDREALASRHGPPVRNHQQRPSPISARVGVGATTKIDGNRPKKKDDKDQHMRRSRSDSDRCESSASDKSIRSDRRSTLRAESSSEEEWTAPPIRAGRILASGIQQISASVTSPLLRKLGSPDTMQSPQRSIPRRELAKVSRGTNPFSPSDVPGSSPKTRRRRNLEPHFNTDMVAFGEVQAQELELARIRSQRIQLASLQTSKTTSTKTDEKAPVTMDLCSSSDDESRSETAASPEPIVLHKFSAKEVLATTSPVSVRLLASSRKVARSESAQDLKTVSDQVFNKVSRQLAWLSDIPTNLLEGGTNRPYAALHVVPLTVFDKDGDLEKKCMFLSSFGRTQHVASTSYLVDIEDSQPPRDQTTSECHVRRVLADCIPRIRECYTRRSDSIISASRSEVRSILEAVNSHRKLVISAALKRGLSIERNRDVACTKPVQLNPAPYGTFVDSRTRMFCGEDAIGEEIGGLTKTLLMPAVKPLSRSVTCITVSRNIRVDDDPLLRFLPTREHILPDQEQPRNVPEPIVSEFGLAASAIDDEVTEYALRAVVSRCGLDEQVFEALQTIGGISQPYSDYATLKQVYDAVQVTRLRVIDAMRVVSELRCPSLSDQHGARLLESSVVIKPSAQRTLEERLSQPPTYFDSHIVRWHLDQKARPGVSNRGALNVRKSGDYSLMMESYRDFFCRLCYCYDCQEHGIQQPQPSRRIDPLYPRLRVQFVLGENQTHTHVEDKQTVTKCIEFDDFENEPSESEQSDTSVSSSSDGDRKDSRADSVQRRSSRSLAVAATTATASWESQEQKRKRERKRIEKRVLDNTEYLDVTHVDFLAPMLQQMLSADEMCGSSCSKKPQHRKSGAIEDDTVEMLVKKLGTLVGNNSCVIARVVKVLSCVEVYEILERQKSERDDDDNNNARIRRSKKDSRGRSFGSSSNRELLDRTRSQRRLDHSSNHSYEPCTHDGSCLSLACSCIRRDHNCEKACSCPRDCPNRSPGCKCSQGACRTTACPCYAAGRECDPDLCVTCGAPEVALLPFVRNNDGIGAFTRGGRDWYAFSQVERTAPLCDGVASVTCANTCLQRGARQKIRIGKSRIHGWGAFAMTPIQRGAFVTEYPGELISQDEAERRGLVYDRVATSYLFDLNEDAVVDAIRMGNKSRFINHGSSQANCHAKVVRVGAEHRITIWAKRDIVPGEELFFDYGYKTDSAPDWSRFRQDNRTGQQKSDAK